MEEREAEAKARELLATFSAARGARRTSVVRGMWVYTLQSEGVIVVSAPDGSIHFDRCLHNSEEILRLTFFPNGTFQVKTRRALSSGSSASWALHILEDPVERALVSLLTGMPLVQKSHSTMRLCPAAET